jgi:hypothetical protein
MKTNQTRLILSRFRMRKKRQCRFIHRSVGEPAEGSLTRYPRINQSRTCFHVSLCNLNELEPV